MPCKLLHPIISLFLSWLDSYYSALGSHTFLPGPLFLTLNKI